MVGVHPVDPVRYRATRRVIDLDAKGFDPEELAAKVAQFHRDGYLALGPVLHEAEVAALREAAERKAADPAMVGDELDQLRGLSLMRMFEYDPNFRDLIVREPLASLAEAILGADCHMMAQNAIRNKPGEAITRWHVDDRVHFPVAEGQERHAPEQFIPCLVMNVLIPLTDVESLEYGPTEVVPTSHYAGQMPPDPMGTPEFCGHEPVTLTARAGDAYMFHNQVWHRGAPNESDRTRLIASVTYSQRFVAQRFYPFLNYHMPEHVLEGADDRLLRMLGKHNKGAYG